MKDTEILSNAYNKIESRSRTLTLCVELESYRISINFYFDCAYQCSFFTTNIIENGGAQNTGWKMHDRMYGRETQICRSNEIYSNQNRNQNLLITCCFIYCAAIADTKRKTDCRAHHILFRAAFWFQSYTYYYT